MQTVGQHIDGIWDWAAGEGQQDDVIVPGLEDCIKGEWWWPHGNMRGARCRPYSPRSASSPKEAEEWLEGEVEEWVLRRGVPLVLRHATAAWDPSACLRDMFSPQWLAQYYRELPILGPRDNDLVQDLTGWTLGDYINYLVRPDSERDKRLYGKDIPPPAEWSEHIANHIYPSLLWKGEDDLLGTVPAAAQVESVMIYVGYQDTHTPAHKDIMGTIGHNVMLWAEEGAYALWFMASTYDRDQVKSFWEANRASIDEDNFFMPIATLATAPFPIYVIKQCEGDLVLVPPEAAHQVVNKGGRSCKFAWNRLSARTLELSLRSALPTYRAQSKPEVYRVKLAAYFALLQRTKLGIELLEAPPFQAPALRRLLSDLPPLLRFLHGQLRDEWLDTAVTGKAFASELFTDSIPYLRSCNVCHCDIFNRCYHKVAGGPDDGRQPQQSDEEQWQDELDICLDCVADGRMKVRQWVKNKLRLCQFFSRETLESAFLKGCATYSRLLSAARHLIPLPRDIYWLKQMSIESSNNLSVATKAALQIVRAVSCHSCHVKKQEHLLLRCTWTRNGKPCPLVYCATCLKRLWEVDVHGLQQRGGWKCYYCSGCCRCRTCAYRKEKAAGKLRQKKSATSGLAPKKPRLEHQEPICSGVPQ